MTELDTIPDFDKAVHTCMYFGMFGILWLEFPRAHRKDHTPMWHVWVGAFICPVLFSGIVELPQGYCTIYRDSDRLGFVANTIGVILVSLAAYLVLKPRIQR